MSALPCPYPKWGLRVHYEEVRKQGLWHMNLGSSLYPLGPESRVEHSGDKEEGGVEGPEIEGPAP